MGQNNRQRRAAKQRQRVRNARARTTQPGSTPDANNHDDRYRDERYHRDVDGEVGAAGAAALLLGRSLRRLARGGEAIFDLQDFGRCAPRHQQAAVDEQMIFAVDHLIGAGWTPLDLYEVVRRKTASSAVTHLLDVVAAATAHHPAPLVHPQWRAQLDQLGATARPTGGVSPAGEWGQRSDLDWPAAFAQLLAVLVVICSLPTLEPVLPAPGHRAASGSDADGIDGRVLRRVRGLLAKAESSEHEEEAQALTAKAQELMTRYSIERAVAESAGPTGQVPVSRRLWLESPYVDAKALLVAAVADSNNCRIVQSAAWGFVTIVGHRADLDVVELLTTSLLVQATHAMTLAGPQTTRSGTSRTRSFRQSFLVAYAGRIGERLRASAHATETNYDAHHGGELVPVLAARREAVQEKLSDLFPALTERTISASHADGWRAGRAAADLARFDVHDVLTSRAG